MDSDTNSEWTIDGVEVEGPKEMHGLALKPLQVEDDLYWNVMKFWYPGLHLATDGEIVAGLVVQKVRPVDTTPLRRRRATHSH